MISFWEKGRAVSFYCGKADYTVQACLYSFLWISHQMVFLLHIVWWKALYLVVLGRITFALFLQKIPHQTVFVIQSHHQSRSYVVHSPSLFLKGDWRISFYNLKPLTWQSRQSSWQRDFVWNHKNQYAPRQRRKRH